MPNQNLNSHSLRVWVYYLLIILISLVLLYFGRSLFIPLLFGLLIALITYPACKKLEQKHWPRSLAIFTVILITLMLFLPLLILLVYELNIFLHDIPRIAEKFESYLPGIQNWLRDNMSIDPDTQSDWLKKIMPGIQDGLSGSLKVVFSATISTLFILILIPVYASLFLYHRGTFVRFLESVIGIKYRDRLYDLLHQSIL